MVSKREISFEKATIYHIISRAIEGKKIYAREDDGLRFIFQMYIANIGKPAFNLYRQDVKKAAFAILNGEKVPPKFITVEHPPLVNFLSFALVLNHHHFLLVPNTEKGIPKYLQKLHGGFAKYFNLKYNRRSTLFERKYKIVPIKTDFQCDAVIRYINVKNPLDVYQPGWTKIGLNDQKRAFDFLNSYDFSSFPDLFGERNSKILAPRSILEKYLGKEITKSHTEFINFIEDYLQANLVSYYPLFLEEEENIKKEVFKVER